MPTLQRLADNGLMYSQWHTTALCSPTRSTFLTGRNHHQNGFASITERRPGFPGVQRATSRPNCAPMATVLRDRRLEHVLDRQEPQRSRRRMDDGRVEEALAAREWATTASTDSSAAKPTNGIPTSPRTTTTSISRTRRRRATTCRRTSPTRRSNASAIRSRPNPTSRGIMWFCPGANHAPHHAPQEYIDKYKGMFDDGYEAYREWVLPRMIDEGAPARRHRAHADQSDARDGTLQRRRQRPSVGHAHADEKKRFRRMAEVYAGFSEYTDAQVGRIIDYLEQIGPARQHARSSTAPTTARRARAARTARSTRTSSSTAIRTRWSENMQVPRQARQPGHLQPLPDRLGDGVLDAVPDVQALLVPGGTCDPLVISLAQGHQGQGRGAATSTTTRTDIVPTILDCCGVEMPEDRIAASSRSRCPASRCATPSTPPTRRRRRRRSTTRCSARAASGRRAGRPCTEHGPISGLGNFDKDRWQLFHTDEDRSEAHDLADAASREGEGAQDAVVRARRSSTTCCRWTTTVSSSILQHRVPSRGAEERPVHLLPGNERGPGALAANTHGGRSRSSPRSSLTGDAEGVIFAQGSRFGGHALFIKDGKLHYVYNFLGIPPEQRLTPDAPKSGTHIVGIEFTKEKMGEHKESLGIAKLYVDDVAVAQAPMRTMTGQFAITGEGLCIGYDSGDAVSTDYKPKFEFKGGRIIKVVFDVGADVYVDAEAHLAAAMARD